MRVLRRLFVTIPLLLLSANANAAECLEKLASFDLIQDTAGDILLPVRLQNTQATFALDLNGPHSALMDRVAGQINLPLKPMGQGISIIKNGERVSQTVDIPSVTIGPISSHMSFLVLPQQGESDAKIDGWFGLDILSNLDIEIDFGTKKISFFRPTHCDDEAIVYWTKNYQALPITRFPAGNYEIPAQLNGHDLRVGIGASTQEHSFLLSHLSAVLELKTTDPGMKLRAPEIGSRGFDVYNYSVDSLKLGGLELGPQTIGVVDDVSQNSCSRSPNCFGAEAAGSLSLNQLKPLHIYIAYQAKKFYVSAADVQ